MPDACVMRRGGVVVKCRHRPQGHICMHTKTELVTLHKSFWLVACERRKVVTAARDWMARKRRGTQPMLEVYSGVV